MTTGWMEMHFLIKTPHIWGFDQARDQY